jgi:aspartyl-tRNA(Asn)/glutamyl-tRNA(Gln) amidotransferase subunit A
MGADELAFLGAAALQRAYRQRSLSPVEVTRALIARLERFDGGYRTHTTLCAEAALAAAREAEVTFARQPDPAPLTGIPVSHKDNLKTAGVYTGAHSRSSFAGIPNESATAVARLHADGAILLGKTNTTEFACGDQLEHGDTPNPWDPTLYSGASSAGSASALAAGFVPLATGTDTGGSIRAPAALCGIVGVKPTFGRVSRHGLIPLTWSMDHVGPMTRSVEDAALMLRSMAGHDPRDPSSSRESVPDYTAALDGNLAGLRIGVGIGHFQQNLEPAVASAFSAAVEVARGLGARIVSVELPMAAMLGTFARILTMWEAFGLHAANLRREGDSYGPKARCHITSGGLFDAADVSLAQQLRERWIAELASAFSGVDVILTPTLPFTAVTREAWVQDPPDTSWATRGFNLSGTPALTLPCGRDERGRPIGLQVAARAFEEATMFRVAHAIEQSLGNDGVQPQLLERTPPRGDGTIAVGADDDTVLASIREGAQRQALHLSKGDLARVARLVREAHEGIVQWRLAQSHSVEPSPPFAPQHPRGAP